MQKNKNVSLSTAFLFILLQVFTLACGREQSYDEALEIAGFEGYIEEFERAAVDNGYPLKITALRIQFGPMSNPNHRAICELRGGQVPTITVLKPGWDSLSEAERESLIFHELGHCVLYRKHTPKSHSHKGHPDSLMEPYLMQSETYLQNRPALLAELFSTVNDLKPF